MIFKGMSLIKVRDTLFSYLVWGCNGHKLLERGGQLQLHVNNTN